MQICKTVKNDIYTDDPHLISIALPKPKDNNNVIGSHHLYKSPPIMYIYLYMIWKINCETEQKYEWSTEGIYDQLCTM